MLPDPPASAGNAGPSDVPYWTFINSARAVRKRRKGKKRKKEIKRIRDHACGMINSMFIPPWSILPRVCFSSFFLLLAIEDLLIDTRQGILQNKDKHDSTEPEDQEELAQTLEELEDGSVPCSPC